MREAREAQAGNRCAYDWAWHGKCLTMRCLQTFK